MIIIRSMKKVLSSVVIATCLIISTASIGFCQAAAPVLSAKVNRPALRAAKIAPVASVNPSVMKLEGDICISKGNPNISLSLRDSDVKQVLRMFADKAGLNIIFHSSVDGKATLDLVNMPLNDAFKLLLQVTNLTYYIDNNTMVVASAKEASGLNMSKQNLSTIPLKYIDSSVMADFLNKNIFAINKPGLSNTQVAITNPGTNEILIFGTENDYRMAKKIIEKFDIKPSSTTYTVNHTTPKEMADLLCTVLFPPLPAAVKEAEAKKKAEVPTASAVVNEKSAKTIMGSVQLSLGAGVVACTYNNQIAAGSLSSIGTQSMAIAYFPQHGTVLVSGGSPQQQELVKEFIAKNDKKQPQAYLEISIIELSETGSQDFQNTWKIWSEMFSATFDGSTRTNPLYPTFFQGDGYTLVDSGFPPKVLGQFYKYTGPNMLTYAINYLIKNEKGRVLANPRIMITNGELSTIDLTSDYIKSVKTQYIQGTGTTPVAERTYEISNDDGIKVDMTPFISPDGYVTLNIKPVYATVKEKIYTGSIDNQVLAVTLLQRRNLDLKNVRIKDSETLVIGGMIREEETKSVSKIPVLGDLPGVGSAFRNSNTVKNKQELVIMITPKIIKDAEDMGSNPGINL